MFNHSHGYYPPPIIVAIKYKHYSTQHLFLEVFIGNYIKLMEMFK